MSALCSCGVSLLNTGRPNCIPIFGVTKQLVLVPMIADDGTENSIDPTTTLNSAYFTALINQADDSKRWYPTGAMKNVSGERADPITESFEDGSKIFIRQGVRNFSGLLLKGGPVLLNQLNSNRCSTFGVYMIDSDGSIYGKVKNSDGLLFPIEVQAASFNGKLVFTTDTTVEKIMLGFEWGVDERDEDLRMIQATSITGINLSTASGLIDAYCEVVSCSQTSMELRVFNQYGNMVTGSPIEGLLVADFVSSVTATASKIRNTTDSADVTITSVTESTTTPGTYTLAYASQTVADVLQPLVKKNGLDGATMIGTVGTVV
jgi:hypothetical protein